MHPPASSLTPDQAQHFRDCGFLALRSICPPEEVKELKRIIYRLFEQKTGWEQGAQFDMVGADDGQTAPVSPQIIDPVAFAPELKETYFRRNAMAIACELLGPGVTCSYEHAIYKPARVGAPTPWHQDEAFRQAGETPYDAISFWMPLQEVTAENGCLEFIPRSHLGPILSHRSPNDDPRVHALECDGEFDRTSAVRCPLPPGGATIHHCRTLHAAGANTSDRERCAYVLTFKAPRAPGTASAPFPWLAEKRTARQLRREAFRNRGGLLGRAARKLKSLLSPS